MPQCSSLLTIQIRKNVKNKFCVRGHILSPKIERQRQSDLWEFQACQSYRVRPIYNKTKNKCSAGCGGLDYTMLGLYKAGLPSGILSNKMEVVRCFNR